jgi:hypothetical protein
LHTSATIMGSLVEATPYERRRAPLPAFLTGHVLAGSWVITMLVAAHMARDEYRAAMQEDRIVEWWTALLFLVAAVITIARAIRSQRHGDLLVGLFCLLAAGEEVSWGQRLLGYTPPAAFLEHNAQQELNIHNFRDVIGQPKWLLVMILAGYGIVLPALNRFRVGQRVIEWLRLTVPPTQAMPWFALAILLLAWYPVQFTGEWVETLSATLFVVTLAGTTTRAAGIAVAAFVAAVGFSFASGRNSEDAIVTDCARRELDALGADVERAATARLRNADRVHKRVWTAARDRYLDWNLMRAWQMVGCPSTNTQEVARRRRYAVDPWGTAYWLLMESGAEGTPVLSVYSFGPNRRRDGAAGTGGGDDIVAAAQDVR